MYYFLYLSSFSFFLFLEWKKKRKHVVVCVVASLQNQVGPAQVPIAQVLSCGRTPATWMYIPVDWHRSCIYIYTS